jgi:TolB-like protein/DNA-binding winged helix-turn-helix (wHTH) protein
VNSSIGQPQVYNFGVFEVDTLAHELRKQGVRIRLQEQPYQILLLLLERAGQVVTRDELRQRIWPASVFIDFDHGVNNSVARLREALGDAAGAARFIETVPRVGYRFVGALTTGPREVPAAVPSSPPTASDSPRSARGRWGPRRWLALAGVVAAAVLLAALLRPGDGERLTEETVAADGILPTPSIAVLPFVNLSSDPDGEYFSDGLTEEIVTRLGGIHGLRVVARTSSYRYKDKQESTADIARALQVDHLLQGSVRRSGARVRVAAQLVDARVDEHIWSQTFDRDADDILGIQEEIAFSVAAALKVSLLDADEFRIRRRGTNDAEAYRLYLIALPHLLGRARPTDPSVAKRSLDAAIERDPDFAAAHAGLARFYFRRAWGGLNDIEDSARLGTAAAEHAVALDPASIEALQARANFRFWRHRFRGDYEAFVSAESDMQRAIELDPTNSVTFEDFGRALIWHEPALAANLLEMAIRTDPLCVGPNVMIASLLGNRGQLDAARARCTELLERYPEATTCHMALATLETYFGNFERAVDLLRTSEKAVRGAARIQLWSVYMSLGDRAGALQWLDFGDLPMEKPLSAAARHAMDGRYAQAYEVLEQHRGEYPFSRLLDLPTAKFALIAGRPQQALRILEQRLPDLASGIEPIGARNVIPALDLATARMQTGAEDQARALLERVIAYLDGPGVLRLPLFAFQSARAHALAGHPDAALLALDRAYAEGFRTTWALDLRPQSLLYIDPIAADPAFVALRDDPRLEQWFERLRAENARQRERLRAQLAQATTG